MELICRDRPDGAELARIWQRLKTHGGEVIPPLDRRESTCQQALQGGRPDEEGPEAYFEELKRQRFLLAEEGGQVAGFFSYRYGYVPPVLTDRVGENLLGLYVTTIIVGGDFRRRGIAGGFYRLLSTRFPERRRLISTRTWSGNAGHIVLLERLGFSGPVRIPDDRGAGIDTVYYYQELKEGETWTTA